MLGGYDQGARARVLVSRARFKGLRLGSYGQGARVKGLGSRG